MMELPQFKPFLEEITTFLNKEAIVKVTDFTSKRIGYLDKNYSRYEKWINSVLELGKKEEIFFLTTDYQRKAEKALHKEKDELLKNEIFSIIDDFQKTIDDLISPISKEIILNQEERHFSAHQDDKLYIKSLKKIKKLNYSIAKKSKQILKGREYQYNWKRTVPANRMLIKFLKINFSNELLKLISNYLENIGRVYLNKLKINNEIDKTFLDQYFQFSKEEERKNLNESKENFESQSKIIKEQFLEDVSVIKDKVLNSYENEYNKFISQYNIVDTIEASRSKYSEKIIAAANDDFNKKFSSAKKQSQLFFEAVFDRIEYYRDLLWFTNLFISKSFSSTNKAKEYNLTIINPKIKSIIDTISKSKSIILENKDNFISTVKNEKDLLIEKLDQEMIVDFVSSVTNSKSNLFLEEYTIELGENLDEFSKNYKFVQPANLNFNLSESHLKEFSPKDIISPLILTKLSKEIENIKRTFEAKTSKLVPSIIGLARIVEFNLDSSLSKYEESNDAIEEAKEIAVSGLERSTNKIQEISKELDDIYAEIREKLDSKISYLLDDLFVLSNIERLLSIKLQISKEKAVQEANEKVQLYIGKFNNRIEWLYNKIVYYFNHAKASVLGITTRVGLVGHDVELSEAMADYLVRVSSSMENLPFVYRRLFAGDALTDSRIFIGREKEIAKLTKAFQYWQNNQISSVMLIGEKGSGTSSLISIGLNKLNIPNKIYRKKSLKTIYKEEDLLTYLKDLLDMNRVVSIDELIDNLQNSEKRIVVVIENFENFFLRVVDGFDAVKKMFEIVSSTSRNVLWILTCNTFAWNYLNKVISIKDFFIFNIHMSELTEKSIKEIILMRHSISGYGITYLSSPSIEKQKAFKKLDEKEKQFYLQREYFENLHKTASNNIGIALFLWLRSIKSADEEEIKISSDVDLDFSFLKELSDQKLFSIMALILHDGLSLEEHSAIFNLSLKSSQLLFATLLDDGIIFLKDSSYKVNFQLYKPLVNLLRSKNILH